MAEKLDGSAIVANTIPSNRIQASSITQTQLQPALYTTIVQATHPKIRSLTYPGNDTAANTSGGDTIVVNGTGFGNTGNVQIYINGNAVSSITVTNANSVSFTAPALSAATYPLYLINTSDGSTAILIPGIQYSGTPTWTTTTPLTAQQADTAWNIQLVATSDSAVSYSLQAGSSLPAGITLAANGLISGTMSSPPEDETTYNFTVVANDLEQQDASRAFSVSVTVAALDPFFPYTTLLLHGDGTNNANNHAFVDSSTNNFAITRNGNATQGTFSPFSPTGWSNYFDGSTDSLTATNNAAYDFGSGAFTIEAWAYPTTASQLAFAARGQTTGFEGFILSTTNFLATTNGSSWDITITFTNALIANAWNHVAIVRNGNVYTAYLNGVANGTTTVSGTIVSGTAALVIGRRNGQTDYSGYISNFRIVKGTAVYTSNFTPSITPLTAITNTSLLTCQSNRFIDNSTNAFAITRNGDVSVQAFSPFAPSAKYSAATNGGSAYFDGTGDYLALTNNAAFGFGSGDFTMECWFYKTTTNLDVLIDTRVGATSATGMALYVQSNTLKAGNDAERLAGGTIVSNSWNHCAVVRSGNNLYLYLNGTRTATAAFTTAQAVSSSPYIGNSGSNEYTGGYLASVRILKGTAQYTGSTYTIPTAPLTNIANTSLLCNFTNAGILDSVGKNVLETLGDARVNTSVKKFGTGSMYFDGTGDFLQIPASRDFEVAGDITIEFWVYWNSIGNIAMLFGWGAGATGKTFAYTYSDGRIGLGINGTNEVASAAGQATTGSWIHLAFVRSGSTTTIYKNGVSIASGTTAVWYASTGTESFYIGGSNSITDLDGYIDDFRITKGIARYRYNFTPPTKAFNDGDGNLATPTSDVLVGDQVNLPVFPYTTLLLHGDGTNNANNHAFLDSSTNNFAITRNGNATQGTFSPFSPTGWSNFFDGNGDYLSFTGSSALTASADFTFECWIFVRSIVLTGSSNPRIIEMPNGLTLVLVTSTNNLRVDNESNGTSPITTGSGSIQLNQWMHLAVVRSGSTLTAYLNGVNAGSATYSTTFTGTGTVTIGYSAKYGSVAYFDGYISNLRYIVGNALYTANFTPPTSAFTAVANTQLLTCQNNRFIDNSNNAFALTRGGNASVQAFSPFPPSVEYTANTHGGSAYFDGTGDYLSLASNTAFAYPGDFTIECWVYLNATGQQHIYEGRIGTTTNTLLFFINASTQPSVYINGSVVITSSTALTTGQWYHLATSRVSNTLYLFVNGVSVATPVSSSVSIASGNGLYIGINDAASGSIFNGYISSLRVLKGTGYTSMSVPTAPLTAISNTQLLLSATNAGILDSTGKNVLETVGDAKVNTAIKKYGTGSMYFDGSGDYLSAIITPDLVFGTGDMTIEAWVYPITTSGIDTIFDTRVSGGYGNDSFTFQLNDGALQAWAGSYSSGTPIATSGTVSTNTWTHVAFSRAGGVNNLFINGLRVITNTTSWNQTLLATNLYLIGESVGISRPFHGYIDDLRITKGIARYITNFTPPTAAFLNK